MSDTYKLNNALKSRGVVMKMTYLATHKYDSMWQRKIFTAMHQQPVQPADAPPGLADVLAADQRVRVLRPNACVTGAR